MNANTHPNPLYSFAEAIPHGIVVLDANQQVLWSNRIAQTWLGLPGQPAGIPVQAILNPSILDQLADADVELEAPNSPSIRLSLTLRPYLDHQHILVLQDISRTHRLESMRKVFIANVSHELRTPLTVFRGYLELLRQHPAIDQGRYIEILQLMFGQSERMSRLVEDLLLLSRLESDMPDMENHQLVPIASMIKHIAEDAQSLSGEREHRLILELDESLEMIGDASELRSAFSNLIYNAVNYTPAGGWVKITWRRDARGCCLSVQDNGPGIAKKYIPRITQRFYRVDKARSSNHGGTGLGLAIVKHVLLRHHGELLIESELNVGSTFTCIFPEKQLTAVGVAVL